MGSRTAWKVEIPDLALICSCYEIIIRSPSAASSERLETIYFQDFYGIVSNFCF